VKEIGIIGFGRFGQLIAKHLNGKYSLFASDIKDKTNEAKKLNANFTSIEECAKKSIVIIAVPISEFEKTVENIKSHIQNQSMVLDVCSIKEMPVNAMKEKLPEAVEVIGTHPLFGPDTADNTLEGKKIALCPVRTQRLEKVKDVLHELGMETIVTTPEEHDKQMSKSLLLIHYLGRALSQISAENVDLYTPTHKKLMALVEIVKNDSEQLFRDMHLYNQYSQEARKELIDALTKLDKSLEQNGN